MTAFADLTTDDRGLVTAVVQDADSGAVLMVAAMNQEAYDRTLTTEQVHFWSRSRQSLWRKGETSGNTLELVSITPDCDADALLVSARPAGPTCHTGTRSCFEDPPVTLGEQIGTLVGTLRERVDTRPEGSYTVVLVDDPNLAARKVLEEAGELAFAAKDIEGGGARRRVVEEAADLMYHVLALLAAVDVEPSDVGAELERRRVAAAGDDD